ncbi:MAG TPA: hypothetical protein VHZ29_03390 [Rhizomicrobium sp.]|jgi:hypothetical protein|nr:hypothetical protein [Rhizomicrobium sp.]
MQAWNQFYEMTGGAAATLLGLLFVSVSLNAETILGSEHKHSKRLAEQAFQNYLAALVVSLMVVIPDVSAVSMGYTLLSVCATWSVWAVVRMVQAAKQIQGAESRIGPLRRYISTSVGFGLLIYSAWLMITGSKDHSGYTAAGVMLLVVSATVASWELLIRLAESRYRRD